MYCAMPVPIIENAGSNIQHHQARHTQKRCSDDDVFERSIQRCFFAFPSLPATATAFINLGGLRLDHLPRQCCGTRLIFAPHPRQKLAPSRFCVAHFGQNIYFPPFISSRRWRLASYKSTPAATDTFNDSSRPATGIRTSVSQCSRTRRCKPFPSLPRNTAAGSFQSHSV